MDRMNPAADPPAPRRSTALAFVVLAAGVSAALHVGKLPPAVPALRAALGIGLVEVSFLLSLVQVAGMLLALAIGALSDTLGLRRGMLIGLLLLAAASAAGGFVAPGPHALALLLALRALEGVGFLIAVMPGPALIRALAPRGAERAVLGLWGAYMPFGVALALLAGPVVIEWAGWQGWWLALASLSVLAAVALAALVPADTPRARHAGGPPVAGAAWRARLRETVGAPGPRALALGFAVYSSQWIAVIGFLPAIYDEAGVPAGWSAVFTAAAAAMNIIGNVSAGWLLQRGVAPQRLLRWGFAVMALGTLAAFAQIGQGELMWRLPAALRYMAVCAFSLFGGMVPATLFTLSMRLAPSAATVSTTVGLMQQASSLGQFLSPPLVAWLAHRAGGWHWTWAVTLACSLTGIIVAGRLGARWHAASPGLGNRS